MTPSEQLMKTAMEAWGEGDLEPLRSALHDDVVWISAATEWDDRLRSGGIQKGRANVIAHISKVATAFFISRYTTKEIVSSGEIVWGIFEVAGRYVDGSHDKTFKAQTACRWRVREGKIIEHQGFYDTSGLLAQVGYGS